MIFNFISDRKIIQSADSEEKNKRITEFFFLYSLVSENKIKERKYKQSAINQSCAKVKKNTPG